jgi:tocopherol O-methyltransferase
MITSGSTFDPGQVGAHYDELDRFYREVWGEHIHHGLWQTGRESADEATRRLIAVVAEQAGVQPGDRVCDVGCGYGGTARALAKEYGAKVTALTVSRSQYEHVLAIDPDATNPTYLLLDWLASGFEPSCFDVVIAIESTEHMADLASFFGQVARVLKPAGRLIVCAWLSRENPRFWERRSLLEPICREGRLRGIGSASEYRSLAQAAGLVPVSFQDVSRQVKRTWPICAWRVARGLLREPSYRQFLVRGKSSNKVFAFTLLRIWLAYELGSLRYGILTAIKPRDEISEHDHVR